MKRPLMWFCFLGIAITFMIRSLALYINPPPDYSGEVLLTGRLVKKEIRNNRPVFYLKECFLCFPDSSFEEEFHDYEIIKVYNDGLTDARYEKIQGVVCYSQTDVKNTDYDDLRELEIGSCLFVSGRISKINHGTNPGEFDSLKYYRARGYEYTMFETEVLNCSGGNALLEELYRLRLSCCDVLLSSLGDEYGGILCAILFGEKSGLSGEIKDLFTDGGIAHILAISGLHISLIGAFLYALLDRYPVPRFVSFLLTVLILVLYGYSVGFAPSVFRAVFMFSYRLLAKLLRKSYDMPTALSLSAFLTCLCFPYMVLDSSFQLTYLACIGIIFIFPCFLPFTNRSKRWWDALFVGFAVFVATLPVVICSFHQASLSGFILNFFVLPAMPVLFVCAFGVILFWNWLKPVAYILALVCKAILFSFSFGVELLTGIPFFMITAKTPSAGRIVIYTTLVVLLCVIASRIRRRMKLEYYIMQNRKVNEETVPGADADEIAVRYADEFLGFRIVEILYGISFGFLLFLACVILLLTPKKACLTFLDVGQGDGIFIRTKNGEVFMIDGGSTSRTHIGENVIVPYLKYEGEREVDLWFLTHEDADHVNGFEEVLSGDEIKIRAIAIPSVLKDEFEETVQIAQKKDVEVLYLEEGDCISSSKNGMLNDFRRSFLKEEYSFIVASPDSEENYRDSNSASLTLLYQEGECSVLFMGDAETQAEQAMLGIWEEYGDGKLEILKCAHHGSANNTNSEGFISALKPERAIISCGRNNRYGHPHEETLKYLEESGAEILRTDRKGAIVIRNNTYSVYVH